MLSHPKVRLWLGELGIDSSDTEMLFELLDDGDGEVQRDEFVNGITRLKGEARAQDLVPVATNCMRILAHCKVTRQCCEDIAAKMHMLTLATPRERHPTAPQQAGKARV